VAVGKVSIESRRVSGVVHDWRREEKGTGGFKRRGILTARNEPGDLIGNIMLLEQPKKSPHADFRAEDPGAVVGEGVVFVVAGTQVA
jgi:hypothetical protein